MNSDNFLIEEFDIEQAQELTKTIENDNARQRAVANVLGAKLAEKYFDAEYNVDVSTGIHNVTSISSKLEISDVYINDNYIDVRLYFNENELCVPKSHFDYGILPVAYMFIKLDETVSGGLVAGFIAPENISGRKQSGNYYHIEETDLVSFYEIEPLLTNNYNDDIPDNIQKLIYKYIDNSLDEPTELYQSLIKSREARIQFAKSANAHTIYRYVSIVGDTSPNIETSESIEDSIEETTLNEDIIDNIGIDSDLIEQTDETELTMLDDNIDSGLIEFNDIDNSFEALETNEDLDNAIIESENFSINEDSINLDEETELTSTDSIVEDFSTSTTPSLSSIEEYGDGQDNIEIELSEDFDTTIDETNDNNVSDEFETIELAEDVDTVEIDAEEILIDDNQESFENYEEESNNNSYEAIETEENIYQESEISEIEQENTEGEITQLDLEDEPIDNTNAEVIEENISTENISAKQENTEEIEVLFNQEPSSNEDEENATYIDENIQIQQAPRKQAGLLPLLGVATIIAALGYYGYNHFMVKQQAPSILPESNKNITKQVDYTQQPVAKQEKQLKEAMPNETIENTKAEIEEIGNAISIPAIENNLDASIIVSNLKISWEVPASFASNSIAKKYLTKLGKIIQINLKSELLLLSKPPISNRIAVELEMNNNGKFVFKNFTKSSGEKSVDAVIKQTINKVLELNLNVNTSSITNLKGNPILVIQL